MGGTDSHGTLSAQDTGGDARNMRIAQERSGIMKTSTDELSAKLSDLIEQGEWMEAVGMFEAALRSTESGGEDSTRREPPDQPRAGSTPKSIHRKAWNQALRALAVGNRGQDALVLLRRMEANPDSTGWPDRFSYSTVLEVR